MDERQQALELAARTHGMNANPEQVIRTAEMYLAFLLNQKPAPAEEAPKAE